MLHTQKTRLAIYVHTYMQLFLEYIARYICINLLILSLLTVLLMDLGLQSTNHDCITVAESKWFTLTLQHQLNQLHSYSMKEVCF